MRERDGYLSCPDREEVPYKGKGRPHHVPSHISYIPHFRGKDIRLLSDEPRFLQKRLNVSSLHCLQDFLQEYLFLQVEGKLIDFLFVN